MEKILRGIPRLTFRQGGAFTPVGALGAVAKFLGRETSYAWLMGVSGAAFRLAWSPAWGLDMVNATPKDVVAEGARWLGLHAEHRLNDGTEVAWGHVRASIDGGIPALSCGLAGAPEFCVIAGYREGPARLLVRSYYRPEEGYAEVPFRPWQGWNFLGFGRMPLVLLRRAGEPDQGSLIRTSLETALDLAHSVGPPAGGTGLVFGLAAYDAWRRALAEGAGFAADVGVKAYALALNLQALADARRAAGEYLQVVAALQPAWARGLRRAAEHYRHEVAVLAEARRVLPYPVELEERAEEVARKLLGDPERRQRFGDFLRTARAEDAEALEWISMTLRGEVTA